MKYFIKTFGCQQNVADSERLEAAFKSRGMTAAKGYHDANYVIINTCMVRHSAESRVYGLIINLDKIRQKKIKNKKVFKIIVTGCLVGLSLRDKSGQFSRLMRERLPQVDEFMPIEEVGFNYEPVRQNKETALLPISNGCNNFCTYCVVPFTRGREVSRPYDEIISEAKNLKSRGYKTIILLGQNVNSYGTDLINLPDGKKPVYVKHLGRYRIPTLFPHLLEDIAKMGFEKVDFISSNPWDFSNELIEVISKNKNITRTIHLPVQSGDDNVLKRMNRWYTAKQYLDLISKLKTQISNVKFTTDIIVGFCGETDDEFANTVNLVKKVGFVKAYLAMYSPRFGTSASKTLKDDIPYKIKKKRWQILEDLINKPYLKNSHA